MYLINSKKYFHPFRNRWAALQSHQHRQRGLRLDVLRPGLQPGPGEARRPVQLQIPLVLLRRVRRLRGRGVDQRVQLEGP